MKINESINFDEIWDINPRLQTEKSVLFKNNLLNEKQKSQLSIFYSLENNINYCKATKFKNLVHFQHSSNIPLQRWFPYREGYSTELVTTFLQELNIRGNVFDPFAGSGTTLISARNANLQSYGIDINPVSVLVARTKNVQYSAEDIDNIIMEKDKIKTTENFDTSCICNIDFTINMFNAEILQILLQYKDYILKIPRIQTKNLFFVAWLSIIEEVSNIKKEGNGIKYKNRKRTPTGYISIPKDEWEKKQFPADKFLYIKNKLLKKIEMYLFDIKNSYGIINKPPIIFNEDCLLFDELFSDELEFTFYSPPYCNCFDYFEIHKVELWLGGFVSDRSMFNMYRQKGFRSNTSSIRNKPIIYKNGNIESLLSIVEKNKLWSNHIPNIVRGYFDDMHTLLKKLFLQTQKNGYVGIVIGNSAYNGVIIPSDLLIAQIANEIGFKIENVFITRHLTTSSQQKKDLVPLNEYLRESIVLLKK